MGDVLIVALWAIAGGGAAVFIVLVVTELRTRRAQHRAAMARREEAEAEVRRAREQARRDREQTWQQRQRAQRLTRR